MPRLRRGATDPAAWVSSAIRRTNLELTPLGAATRALAAVLLLLAVLGTFAGMRKAVPKLQRAVSSVATRSEDAREADLAQFGEALKDVGDSFGANFLALLGSVVLGVGAFGATRAKAGILSDLASVLDQCASNLPDQDIAGDDLAAAVREVQAVATAVAGTRGSIERLNTSLGGFQRDLAQALNNLGTNVSRTIEVRLQEKLANALDEVTKQLGDVAKAVSATSLAYEGLFKDQAKRFEGIEGIAASLTTSAASVSDSVQTAARESKESLESFGKALERAEKDAGHRIASEVEGLSAATEKAAQGSKEALDNFGKALQRAESEAGHMISNEVKGLSEATAGFAQQLEAVSKSVKEATAELSSSLRAIQVVEESLRDAADKELEAIEKMGELTRPYVDRLDTAIKGLENVAGDTRSGVKLALEQAQEVTRTMLGEFAKLRRDVAGDLNRVRQQIETSSVALSNRVDETGTGLTSKIDDAVGQLEGAGESLTTAERGFSSALERYRGSIEQAISRPRVTIDLSEESIDKLASATRKKRRRFFGRRNSR